MKYNPETRLFRTNPEESSALSEAPMPLDFPFDDPTLFRWATSHNELLENAIETFDEYGITEESSLVADFISKRDILRSIIDQIAFAREYHDLERHNFEDFHKDVQQELIDNDA